VTVSLNSINWLGWIFMLFRRQKKPIFSSERMLHNDYGRKDSVAKISLVVSLKGLGSQDELIGGKPPVAK
jgi:hypothetical protein